MSSEDQVLGNGDVGIPLRDVAPSNPSPSYIIPETYMGEIPPGRRLRVIVVGAGLTGITFHYHAQKVPYLDYTIYDKNEDVAGTWFENRYPGAACDIPSQTYSFLFATNPTWSKFYPPAPEIRQYFMDTARSIGAYEKIELRKKVIDARWDAQEGLWNVVIEDVKTGERKNDSAEILLNGGGILNNWKWPDIPGLHSFGGKLMHTAVWDESYPLEGKNVAAIGCGSSAVQMVPAIAPIVAHLTSFNRSPTYIIPGFAQNFTPAGDGRNFAIPEEEQNKMKADKLYALKKRKELEQSLLATFGLPFQKNSKEQKAWRIASVAMMEQQLGGDQELIKKLIPTFEVGCRRPTPGEGYLEALIKPNCTVVTNAIERITERGLVTDDGKEHVVDTLICATGFDTSFAPRWSVVGSDASTDLATDMSHEPRVYFGISTPKYPNYFTVFGAFSPVAHGSFAVGVDIYVRYILQMIDKMARENIKSFVVKEKVADDFLQHADTWLPRGVWSGSCNAWYKARKSKQPIMYPGTYSHFIRYMKTPHYEHYDFEHLDMDGLAGNSLSWLGSGLIRDEVEGGGNLAYFLDEYIEEAEKETVGERQ